MPVPGRIRRRLALAIVITALIPVCVAVWLADAAVGQAVARFYVPELRMHLDRSLGLYQELARTVKALMRQEALAISQRAELQEAARSGDPHRVQQELRRAFDDYPTLVRLQVRGADGKEKAQVRRARPLDPMREKQLEVELPLIDRSGDATATLNAVFAADRARFDELAEMSQFVDTYERVERRREADEQGYVLAFALLLGITIIAAIGVGVLLARGVSGRITELARATQMVAKGDLEIRVPERGTDEIGDLARAFNRMLEDIAESRARIEYLQRIGAWQEMARRLAHEIKNPLTPIQLAVQEIQRRYDGVDPGFRKLLDTTREVVEDEVGTLRRLVGEFSDFARLPTAHLVAEDLVAFLEEQQERLVLLGQEEFLHDPSIPQSSAGKVSQVHFDFDLPQGPALVSMDRQMLIRVLVNLVENAVQAMRSTPQSLPRLRVRLRSDDGFYNLDVEDSGPGIPSTLRRTVFDPYVTTKGDGTGLGLAIVKKIVVEHGGSATVGDSDLGGAKLRVRLPALGRGTSDREVGPRGLGAQPRTQG